MNVNRLFTLTAVFLLLFINIKSQTAVEYLNVIGNEFTTIQKNTWDYTSSAAHGKSARKVEKRRREVVLATRDAIRKITKLKPFNGTTDLRDSAVSFLNVNFAVLNEDYAKLVDLEEIAEQSYDAMEAYMLAKEKANDKLQDAGVMMETQYSGFAKKHNINLVQNNDKITKNLEKAGKVYKHYNEVYLVFFKSHKQEAYFVDAMQKNDVNGIEQNRNALASTSVEGLEKLKTLKPYEGDNSLIKACDQLLNFYSEESSLKNGTAIFFVSKDNFEKLKSSFDSKPAAQRSKQDVDKFNAAVAEYNKATDNFNRANNELNKKRAALIQAWNNACDSFTHKHVPKK